eukprot:9467416-Pyramimonas_sp.AAC.1
MPTGPQHRLRRGSGGGTKGVRRGFFRTRLYTHLDSAGVEVHGGAVAHRGLHHVVRGGALVGCGGHRGGAEGVVRGVRFLPQFRALPPRPLRARLPRYRGRRLLQLTSRSTRPDQFTNLV